MSSGPGHSQLAWPHRHLICNTTLGNILPTITITTNNTNTHTTTNTICPTTTNIRGYMMVADGEVLMFPSRPGGGQEILDVCCWRRSHGMP